MALFKMKPEVPKPEQEQVKSLERSSTERMIQRSVENDPAPTTLEKINSVEITINKKLDEIRRELSKVMTIDFVLSKSRNEFNELIHLAREFSSIYDEKLYKTLRDSYKGKEGEIKMQRDRLRENLDALEGSRQTVNLLRDDASTLASLNSEYERLLKEQQKAERGRKLQQEGGDDRLNDAQADLALVAIEIGLRKKSLVKKIGHLELAGL